ncbi:MAG: right-handed parallel beta-helix repeat-containing protein [Nitrospirota bacterium]
MDKLIASVTILFLSLLVSACGGGGGGAAPAGPAVVSLSTVTALYPLNGANWNDYVKGTSITATDTLCNAATDAACLHGGEKRVVTVTGRSSCSGITATDTLGVFDWTCDASTGTARVISTGLKNGKYLSDLLNFTTPGWNANVVNVNVAGTIYSTASSTQWWSNPTVINNIGGSLASAGTIYVVTSNSSGTYSIDASKVGVVVKPGAAINGPNDVWARLLEANNKDFIWIEGMFNIQGSDIGISWNFVKFSVLMNVTANNASGINKRALLISGASYNKFTDIAASNNGETGLWCNTCSNNLFTNIRSSNNGFYGIQLDSCSNNVFRNVVLENNSSHGIQANVSSNNVFTAVTTGNTGSGGGTGIGLQFNSSNNNVFSNVLTANNGSDGVALVSSSSNTFSDIASDSVGYDFYLYGSSYNHFTGLLKVNNNCYETGGTNPGLVNWTCTMLGTTGSNTYGAGNSSNATLTSGITLTSSFAGKIVTDDIVNTSDTNGASATYPADPAAFDWSGFQNTYRAWGKDGTLGNLDSRGRWITGGAGRIWDWSLSSSDTIVNSVLAVPTGNDTLTHTWSDASTTTVLRHAIELVGNGNGLCESGETCLYTPNIGAYQGHGNLISAGAFSDGTITGVTLMKFETNGR